MTQSNMTTKYNDTFDVAILGAGIAGTVLATILAKQGVRVLIIDAEVHPRFAVGESTIPHTSLLFSMLGEKYGLRELDDLAYPDRIAKRICTTCGIKRSFSFCYHRSGEEFNPKEAHQFGTSSKDENHFFRQDIDAYLLYLAVHYGAEQRQNAKVATVDIDQQGVTIKTADGESFQARYVVDGTGYKSILAERFDLREKPTRFKHHSRTLFTHMVDVKPFDEVAPTLSLPWHQSTLHHVIERGWFWVIPFNNREGSTNPLISVGLTIDPRKYPKPDNVSPEKEFQQFVERFPSVAKQFVNAKAVRPWVSTNRLQYSSKKCSGYRFCLMSHAAGALDPLFSRGFINTLEIIGALVDPLLEALAENDFAEERFMPVERLHQRVLDYNDRLVNGAFISWADFDLWNAWIRVWAAGTILTEFRLMKALADYTATHDQAYLQGEAKAPVFSDFEDPDYADFFFKAVPIIEAFEAGAFPAKEAAARLFALMDSYEFSVLLSREAMRRAGWLGENEILSDRNLRIAREGYRWALTNPNTRDMFGTVDTFFRWRSKKDDALFVSNEKSEFTFA